MRFHASVMVLLAAAAALLGCEASDPGREFGASCKDSSQCAGDLWCATVPPQGAICTRLCELGCGAGECCADGFCVEEVYCDPSPGGGSDPAPSDDDAWGESSSDDGDYGDDGWGDSSSDDGSGGSCGEPGEACTYQDDCCSGSLCVDYGDGSPICGAECTAGSDCVSGCCGALEGGGGVCAPASFCEGGGDGGGTCTPAGAECSPGDCCPGTSCEWVEYVGPMCVTVDADACGSCLDSCSGLPGCCTGCGCICDSACAPSC